MVLMCVQTWGGRDGAEPLLGERRAGLSEWLVGRRWQRGCEPRPGLQGTAPGARGSQQTLVPRDGASCPTNTKQVSCLKKSYALLFFFLEMKSALVTVLNIYKTLRYCFLMASGFLMKLQKCLFVSPPRSSPPCQDSPCTTWLRTKGSGELCGARSRAPTSSSSSAPHVPCHRYWSFEQIPSALVFLMNFQRVVRLPVGGGWKGWGGWARL